MARTGLLTSLVVALALAGGGAASAGGSGPHANGNGKGNGNGNGNANGKPTSTPTVTTYSGGIGAPECADPKPEVCTYSSTVDAAHGTVGARSEIVRTAPAQAYERSYAGGYIGRSFTIGRGVSSITATLHFSHISAEATAQSLDGAPYGQASLIADIFDSGCAAPDHNCGAPDHRSSVVVAADFDRANQSLPGYPTSTTGDQVLQVTLAMPDGSDLPAGLISIAGMAFADAALRPETCLSTSVSTLCDTSPAAHTGSAKTAIQAQLDSVTWTIT